MVRCKIFSTDILREAAPAPGALEAPITPTNKEIFNTLEEALAFALPYAVEKGSKDRPDLEDGIDSLPAEVNGPWKMSKDVIKRSLEHIYKSLHHTCYIMCVRDGKPVLKKLEATGIPKFFEEAIAAKKAEDPDMFRVLQGKDPRVMQCVIKARSDKESVSKEYMKWINEFPIRLPDGVYILNLTDAVLYRKDGKDPWEPMSAPLMLEDTKPFLPVLGGSGANGYWDVPMPNYDDLDLVSSRKGLPVYKTDWSKKKEVAVFRGGPTGCGTNNVTNMRIKLAGMRRADLDVGLVREKSNNPRYNFKRKPQGIFSIDMGGVPAVPFMNMEEQSKHKYVIHIDGNVAAYRLLNTMLMGSVVLKVEGPYTLWVDHLIRDKEHYVSVKGDLSDLDEVLKWCKVNDSECKRIAAAGREFALKVLTQKYVDESFAKLVWGIVDKSSPTPVTGSSTGSTTGTTITPPFAKKGPVGKTANVLKAAAAKLQGFVQEPSPSVAPPPKPISVAERFALFKAKRAAAAAAAKKSGGRRTRKQRRLRRRFTRKA